MYTPKPFQQQDFNAIKQLMAELPLATIVAHTATGSQSGLHSSHIPLYWEDDGSEYGVLIGHAFQGKPLVKEHSANDRWLVIFQDTGCYISPNWYPNKAKTHKEVPTWNYRAVHLTVEPSLTTDPEHLKSMVGKLSDIHEATQPVPWSLADAPSDYIDKMCKAIVGFRLTITDVQAQFKLSQNKDDATKQSIVENLQMLGTDSADKMATNMLVHNANAKN